MKQLFFSASIALLLAFSSCNNETKPEGTHEHEDGSTHEAHTDTVKPAQEEFKVVDTTKAHSHEEGTKHTHDEETKEKHD